MDNIIHSAEDISLDEQDLKKICQPYGLHLIFYRDLHTIQDINELFQISNNIIILYRTTRDYGHFVSLLNYDDHIEYFDSYGEKPDYELKYSQESVRQMQGRIMPHLTHLFNIAKRKDRKKIVYNKIRLQQFHNHVNTCGRWSALRIKFRHLNIKQFQHLFIGQSQNPDAIVTYLTYLLIDKDMNDLV